MKSEKIKFLNKDGHQLEGRLEVPEYGEPLAYAIFAHCFTCTKNIRAATTITRSLAAKRIATLRFDFTGLGESEGDFSDSTFSSDIQDIISASEFLSENFQAPKLLIGHSLGGAAVLHAASDVPSAVGVVTIGAPFDPEHVSHLFQSSIEEIEEKGVAKVMLAGRPFTLKKAFLNDLKAQNPAKVVSELGKALLVLHSPTDDTVSIDNAAAIYTAAHHPKSFITLDPADHLLTKNEDSEYVGNVIAAWSQRYIEAKELKEKNLNPELNIVSAKTGSESFYTEMMVNTHPMIADEPKSVGGTDLGPTPYDYLMSGLAACTTMTLQMYAKRKEIALDSAIVRVTHSKIHIKDCESCEDGSGRIDSFHREIELVGKLTEEQKNRMLEIADKCPVHKTLHSKVEIKTTLQE